MTMTEPTYNGPASANDHPLAGRAEIVTSDSRKWLVGMRWRSYEVLPDRAQLAEEAESMHTDWIARRVGDEAIQVGFCAAVNKGWPKKTFSLAALLADSHKVPWAGAFPIGNGLWWYIAVRDNYGMMPDGDIVGTREDILRARQEHAALEDFNHYDGTFEQLEELVKLAQAKRTPLESLTASRFSPKLVLGGLGAVALVGVALAVYHYYELGQEQARQALVRQQIQENARKAQQAAVPDVGKILRSLPDPAVWLAACGLAIHSQVLWSNGWQLISQQCLESQLQVTWKRGPGATIAYAPPGAVSDDGNQKVQTIPLPLPAGVAGVDDSVPLREAHDRLTLWAQQHDIAVSMAVVAPPAPKQDDPAAMAAAALGSNTPAPVPQIQISFSVPAAPFALDFSEVPGLRLIAVGLDDVTAKTSDTSHEWKISGVVYGH
jgi:hypothetical protein